MKNLTGQRFGRLVAIRHGEKHPKYNGKTWLCKCDCGETKTVRTPLLTAGFVVSCGCRKKEIQRFGSITHGLSRTREYKCYKLIKDRCYNPNYKRFHDWGGRGIKMCERWLNSFQAFYADMGPRPSNDHSIERIDNNGDYWPGNCYWATRSQQANNRRSNRFIIFNKKTKTIMEWSRLVNIPYATIVARLNYGWSAEDVLTVPVRRWSR